MQIPVEVILHLDDGDGHDDTVRCIDEVGNRAQGDCAGCLGELRYGHRDTHLASLLSTSIVKDFRTPTIINFLSIRLALIFKARQRAGFIILKHFCPD